MTDDWSFKVAFEFRDGEELEGRVYCKDFSGNLAIEIELDAPDSLARQGGERAKRADLDERPVTDHANNPGGSHPPDGARRATPGGRPLTPYEQAITGTVDSWPARAVRHAIVSQRWVHPSG